MSRFVHPRSVLAVRDLRASTRYYTEVLGFGTDPINAPGWSFLSRDSIRLMLGECTDEVPASETGNHSWFLHIMVEELDEFHAEVKARGANVVVPVGNRAHGHREFVVQTPDGHRILFGEPLAWIAERRNHPD
jgi:catechol 2,3-dioxygenase-like lactoylglutathione lyase family enzyme